MKSLSLTPWRGPIFETLKPRNMIANETARERNTANKAAVSIIVLSYNRPAYLRSALESVAAQTERSIEVIAADDGSPDLAVDAVLEEFRARFDRYVYERAERNVGVVANLLRAVRRSSGTYVAVLSDDDVLEHSRSGFARRSTRRRRIAPLSATYGSSTQREISIREKRRNSQRAGLAIIKPVVRSMISRVRHW
jgi:hypothetical protein